MPATFADNGVASRLKDKRNLSGYLDALMIRYRNDTKKGRLQYVFCDDAFLLDLNQKYLDHDTLTDIITFDLSEKATELNGEIYISIERVRENATQFGASYNEELHRVIFHGALHLCGFKDKTAQDEKEMRTAERTCLDEYFSTAGNAAL